MSLLVSAILLAFIVAVSLTPMVRKFALKHHFVAQQNQRTIHQRITPLLGGTAVYLAYLTGIFLVYLVAGNNYRALLYENLSFILGGTLILILGIYDDIKGATSYEKFAIQILAAFIVIIFGYRISIIVNPLGGGFFELGWMSYPVTVFWLVTISNAFNLIDGLDGLASGIGLGAALTMMFVALWNNNLTSALPAGILAAALFGFLIFNFNPAKIFLGDSGSLVIGFWLACFSINGTFRTESAVAILIPMIVFGLPILDTFMAFFRRVRQGINPFKADRKHIHHRLLQLGLSQRQAMLMLNGISYFWGGLAFAIVALGEQFALVISAFILMSIYWGLNQLKKLTILHNLHSKQ